MSDSTELEISRPKGFIASIAFKQFSAEIPPARKKGLFIFVFLINSQLAIFPLPPYVFSV